MSTILLVSIYHFPEGDAGSVRTFNMALALQRLGFRVVVIGMGNNMQPFKERIYNHVRYYTLKTENRFSSYAFFLFRLIRLIKKIGKKEDICAIILGTSFPDVLIGLQLYCSMYNLLLIKDVVEWYSPQQFRLGSFSLQYILKNVENKYLLSKKTHIISISRYLHNYFSCKGYVSVRIPIFFDCNDVVYRIKSRSTKLRIVYAGSPGKKDYLDMLFYALAALPEEERFRIQFTLLGIEYNQLQQMIPLSILEKTLPMLSVLGRKSRVEALAIISNSDFSILLRDSNARYAKAGFPSKLIESFFCSTPIICNLSSDLHEFLIDGKNAIIVNSLSVSDILLALRRVLNLSSQEIQNMGHDAFNICRERFNIDSYEKELTLILNTNKKNTIYDG